MSRKDKDRQRELREKLYAQRKIQGICVACGQQPSQFNRGHCRPCADLCLSRTKKRTKRAKEENRCLKCGEPTQGKIHCVSCQSNESKRREGSNSIRQGHLKYQYGMTLKDYESQLISQGGRCAICGTDTPGSKRKNFAVDHDHLTGKVRGLLCLYCNLHLVSRGATPKMLRAAASYLEKHTTYN